MLAAVWVWPPRRAYCETGTPEQAEWRLRLGEFAASGTAIAPQLVATARHFTNHIGDPIVLRQPQPGGQVATVHGHTVAVGIGDDDDVSLVRIDDASVLCVPIGKVTTQGQTIYACGYGHAGIGRTGGPGIVQGDYDSRSFISTVDIESGDSGGGIFDTSGQLVGVISGVPRKPPAGQMATGDVIATKIDCVAEELTQCCGGGCPGGSCQRPSSGSAPMTPWTQLQQAPPGPPAAAVQQPAATPAATAKEVAAEVINQLQPVLQQGGQAIVNQLQPAFNQKVDAIGADVKAQLSGLAGNLPGSADMQQAAAAAGQQVVTKLTTEIEQNPAGVVSVVKPLIDAVLTALGLPAWLGAVGGIGAFLLHAFKKNQPAAPAAAPAPIVVNIPAPQAAQTTAAAAPALLPTVPAPASVAPAAIQTPVAQVAAAPITAAAPAPAAPLPVYQTQVLSVPDSKLAAALDMGIGLLGKRTPGIAPHLSLLQSVVNDIVAGRTPSINQ